MSRSRRAHWLRRMPTVVWLVIIMVIGLWLRLTGLDWDAGLHVHPDERYLTYLASLLTLPDSIAQYFDSGSSPLNPFNVEWGRSYVYGTAPLFLVRGVAQGLESACTWSGLCAQRLFTGYDSIGLVGRALAALQDGLVILIVGRIGQRAFGPRAGVLAAALYALAVLPIQQSHFFTVDTPATLATALTLWACLEICMQGKARSNVKLTLLSMSAGIFAGLALASKISTWPLVLLITGCMLLAGWRDRQPLPWVRTLGNLVLAGGLTFVAFRIAQPYAFIGNSELEINQTLARCANYSDSTLQLCIRALNLPASVRSIFVPSGRWIEQLALAQGFVDGSIDAPFGIQWANRLPVVFPLINLVFYGLGLPLGCAALFAIAISARRLMQARRLYVLLPLIAWSVLYFAYQGTQWTKSIRYLLPIYPALCILAAWVLVQAAQRLRLGWIWPVLVLAGTLGWALAFTTIYRAPNTRVAASLWIHQNLPDGAIIANEHWDESLPGIPTGFSPSKSFRNLPTASGQLQPYDQDTVQKRADLIFNLSQADYILLSSNRIYGATARLPLRYPLTVKYYQYLFDGRLGFDLVADFHQPPRLGPFVFPDQERTQPLPYVTAAAQSDIVVPYPVAEEAFSVYDHARVLIFKRSEHFSVEAAERLLDVFDLNRTVVQSPRAAQSAPQGLMLDAATAINQATAGTWAELFPRASWLNRWQPLAVLAMLLLVQLLGIAMLPIMRRITGDSFADGGWALGKVLGMLLVAWASWFIASARTFTFSAPQLLLLVTLLVALGAWVHLRSAGTRLAPVAWHSEVIFLLAFVIFMVVRSRNPDLWHPYMGGEKPMDFAYLNAVLKSEHFPPYDPWHAGGSINYYYFGWVLFGFPLKLLGIDPAIGYNLLIPLVYALSVSLCFSVAGALIKQVTHRDGDSPHWLAGGLAALMAFGLGNIHQIWTVLPALIRLGGDPTGSQPLAALQGLISVLAGGQLPIYPLQLYWDATRLDLAVPIAEFPLFTFLYADLHAHMLAMPLVMAALACAIVFAKGHRSVLMLLLAGLITGALAPTNTWDYPALLMLVLAALGLDWLINGDRLLVVALRMATVFAIGRLAFAPFFENYGAAYNSVNVWSGDRTPVWVYLTIHVLFAVPIIWHWVAHVLNQRQRSAGWLATSGFVAASVLLGLLVAMFGAPAAIIGLPLIAISITLFLAGEHNVDRLRWLMSAGAWTLTLIVEGVALQGDIGRMNTVFKFYLQAWLLLSVVAGSCLAQRLQDRDWPLLKSSLAPAMAVILALCALYPLTALPAKMNDRMSALAPRGLDGSAFMASAERTEGPGTSNKTFLLAPDYAAIRWMQDHVRGTPVIMEGTTDWDLYRWGNRFSVYTGLPAVIGWNWHQQQQRASLPGSLVQARHDDVRAFYSGFDPAQAETLLRRYNVRYVVVGAFEAAYYGDEVRDRMMLLVGAGVINSVYANEGTTIFEVTWPSL